MLKSIEMTGATRDIAIQKALDFLQMDRDDVSVEVLDNGKKGFLGIGATDAKVRVTYEAPDEPASEPETAPKAEEKPAEDKKPTRPVFHDVAPDDPRLTTPHLVKPAPKKAEGEAAAAPAEKKADKPRRERAPREPRAPREERPAREPIVPFIDPIPMEEDKIPEPAR